MTWVCAGTDPLDSACVLVMAALSQAVCDIPADFFNLLGSLAVAVVAARTVTREIEFARLAQGAHRGVIAILRAGVLGDAVLQCEASVLLRFHATRGGSAF